MQLVTAFGIPAITAEGYEADDILGTLAKRAARDGMQAIIVTGDSDAFQLIEPNIKVFTSGRMYQDTQLYDEALIRERFGLAPQQLIDFKALKGDTSVNVPGVKGIGEKTAADLLQPFGTVEGVYEHLDEVQPEKLRPLLAEHRETVLENRELMPLVRDVDVTLDPARGRVGEYVREAVVRLFREYEFRTLIDRLPPLVGERPEDTAKHIEFSPAGQFIPKR